MPDMRVLHVLEAAGHGTGRHLVDLVTHATGVAHEVVLPVSPTWRGEPDGRGTAATLREHGVRVHEVPLRRQPLHPDLARAVLAVRSLVHTRDVDVVHGHATVGGVVARLANGPVPVVVTPNGLHPSPVVRRAERLLARRTAAIVAVSVSEREAVLAAGLAPPDRVVVVPNGIALAPPAPHPLDLRRHIGLPPDACLVGWVGRLARQKAPEVLVAAAERLDPDVHVVLVGDGPQRRDVSARVVGSSCTERIHLLGHVPDAAALLPQFDVVALPSRWEGAPYVPLEAFRAGVPVVATDVTGTRDVVRDGHTGWLVPVDDPAALAAALDHALGDPVAARRRTTDAWQLLVTRHDVRTMGRRTTALYRRLAASEAP